MGISWLNSKAIWPFTVSTKREPRIISKPAGETSLPSLVCSMIVLLHVLLHAFGTHWFWFPKTEKSTRNADKYKKQQLSLPVTLAHCKAFTISMRTQKPKKISGDEVRQKWTSPWILCAARRVYFSFLSICDDCKLPWTLILWHCQLSFLMFQHR